MADHLTTWRELIDSEMKNHDETWADVVACTLNDDQLRIKFDPGFGSAKGAPFFLWTESRVYFATEYDGAEGVDSIPRDPSDEAPRHIS